VNRLDLSQVSF